MCIFSITISWEQTHSSSWIHSVCVCVCVSCDDIVKPCSLRRSQESDLQMRSSWTSKMKYSSVLIRGRTLTEHSNLQPSRNTAMCGRTQNMWPGYYFHIHTSLHRHCLRNIVRLFFFFFHRVFSCLTAGDGERLHSFCCSFQLKRRKLQHLK